METNDVNKAVPSVDVPRLVRMLRDSYPNDEQEKIEDEISESLDVASNETLADLLRNPIIYNRHLHDKLLQETITRLLLPNDSVGATKNTHTP